MAQHLTRTVQRTSNLRILSDMLDVLNIRNAVTGHVDSFTEEGAIALATDGNEYLVAWPAEAYQHTALLPESAEGLPLVARVRAGHHR